MKSKEILIIIILAVIILAVILIINYVKANENSDEQTMKCIASKTKLIISKTCSHCARQKEILNDHIDLFNIIYIDEHPEIWEQYNHPPVPAWVINNEVHVGVQSIENLKQLTQC